jgi:hypothetical protein
LPLGQSALRAHAPSLGELLQAERVHRAEAHNATAKARAIILRL